ncbi:MAG: transposase [Deltaproteobacteria bacterium]|nr:transposase [Deltaproteobacteria bacterium]
MFPDDTACTAFLTRLRWPEGFICPVCKTASTPWNECRGLVFRRLLEQTGRGRS